VLLEFPDLGLNRINSEVSLGAGPTSALLSATIESVRYYWRVYDLFKEGMQIARGICTAVGLKYVLYARPGLVHVNTLTNPTTAYSTMDG
jgi:hypothetical protein